MSKFIDIKGKKFGRLTVIKLSHKNNGRIYWLCKCECGTEKIIRGDALKNGDIKSCGCLLKEWARTGKASSTHGLSKTTEYITWLGMKKRCYDKNEKSFKNYGGRGIKICDEWLNDFTVFLKEMGKRPSKKYSIERIDNNKGYCKENCKWATSTEQNRNSRNNRMITYEGKTLCLAEWAERLGMNYDCLESRINRSFWSIERAFTQEVKTSRKK